MCASGIVARDTAKWDWLTFLGGCKTHLPPTINHYPIMSDTYVPLISSGVAGPLGVLHLPRMWQKVSLEATDKLASGYPGIGRGFDAMTCASLGLEEQAVKDYIKKNKPTYPQFESVGKGKCEVTYLAGDRETQRRCARV